MRILAIFLVIIFVLSILFFAYFTLKMFAVLHDKNKLGFQINPLNYFYALDKIESNKELRASKGNFNLTSFKIKTSLMSAIISGILLAFALLAENNIT